MPRDDDLNISNFGQERKQVAMVYAALNKKTTMSAAYRAIFDSHPEVQRIRRLFFGDGGKEKQQKRSTDTPETAR